MRVRRFVSCPAVSRGVLWAFAACLCLLVPISDAKGRDDLRAQLEKDAGSSWEALERSTREDFRCQGTLKEVVGRNPSTTPWDVKFIHKGDFERLEMSRGYSLKGRPAKQVFVYCRGPSYSFFLQKDEDSLPFIVEAFIPRSQAEPRSIFLQLDNFSHRVLKTPYFVMGGRLKDIVREDAFAVSNITRTSDREHPITSVEFTRTSPKIGSSRGTIRLDPAFDWAIVGFQDETTRSEAAGPGPKVYSSEESNTYARREGQIVLNSFNHRLSYGGKVRESYEWTLKDASFAPIDDSEFTLSAFGLPEVSVGTPAKKSIFSSLSWVFWACLAGAVLGVVGLWRMSAGAKKAAVQS